MGICCTMSLRGAGVAGSPYYQVRKQGWRRQDQELTQGCGWWLASQSEKQKWNAVLQLASVKHK